MEHLMLMDEQQLLQEPITALSLLEELMSSGLLISGDFVGLEGHEQDDEEDEALLDIDIISTMIFCERELWLQRRHHGFAAGPILNDDNNDNDMLDPPLFASTADFLLSPTAESVASDLSSDDDDDDDNDSLQVGSLMNQPRPGLQEEEDDLLQQHQFNDSRMSFAAALQYRPGLQDDDGDCRPPEPVTASITTTTESVHNTSSSSSSSYSTSLYPVSPNTTTSVNNNLDWSTMTAMTTTSTSPIATRAVKKPSPDCSWSMRQSFRVVAPPTKMASFYYSDL